MSHTSSKQAPHQQAKTIQQYYQWQSKIYDLSRWSFLFGRKEIIKHIPFAKRDRLQILEVGCGTGFNINHLAKRFTQSQITGVDISPDMLQIARRNNSAHSNRVNFCEAPYGQPGVIFPGQMDLVLFSYALTMINPQWAELIQQAKEDLKPGGYIAVVDFHDSKHPWFKHHMGNHHVRMDGHLADFLAHHFVPLKLQIKSAYGGIWQYMIYLGQKPNTTHRGPVY